jgi:hypothetical protein
VIRLLDVNVLLALAWRHHVHHGVASRWFAAHHSEGWATCPFTQASFVRLSCLGVAVKVSVSIAEAMAALESMVRFPDHHHWPVSEPLASILPEIRGRLVGHGQVTDAILLDLAIRNGGALATFDRGVLGLLAPGSRHRSQIEILPI